MRESIIFDHNFFGGKKKKKKENENGKESAEGQKRQENVKVSIERGPATWKAKSSYLSSLSSSSADQHQPPTPIFVRRVQRITIYVFL